MRDLHVGPWFVLYHFPGVGESVYRGDPSRADVSIAMGYAGHLQIELIAPNDHEPPVYRETIERRGHGFHHHGIASDDMDRDAAEYVTRGFEIASSAPRAHRWPGRLPRRRPGGAAVICSAASTRIRSHFFPRPARRLIRDAPGCQLVQVSW